MNKLALIIVAILLPPVAVAVDKGIGKTFVINLILSLLLWIPGIIHAVWVVTR